MGSNWRSEQTASVDTGEERILDVGSIRHAGNLPRVRLAKATSESIIGTSTSTPTTVASAAPEPRPKRPMATATASSKKFDVPIIAQGAAILCGSRQAQAQA